MTSSANSLGDDVPQLFRSGALIVRQDTVVPLRKITQGWAVAERNGQEIGLVLPNECIFPLRTTCIYNIRAVTDVSVIADAPSESSVWAQFLRSADHVRRLTALSGIGRTCDFLLELSNRLVLENGDLERPFLMPISQASLGSILGMSVIHMNRILGKLRDEKALTTNRQYWSLNASRLKDVLQRTDHSALPQQH